jgi:hypothetical protein
VKPLVKMMAMNTATVSAPAKLPKNTSVQLRMTPAQVAPGRLSITASGASVNTPVSRSNPSRYRMQKPTGNSSAPISGLPVLTVTDTAKAAASARMAPAM